MTKKEFVNAFAEKGELKIKDSERLVNAFLGTIEDALLKGDGVRFIGFGSWEVKERSAREVKNPQTGKMIKVEAKKVVKFKVGKPLADKVAAFCKCSSLMPLLMTRRNRSLPVSGAMVIVFCPLSAKPSTTACVKESARKDAQE